MDEPYPVTAWPIGIMDCRTLRSFRRDGARSYAAPSTTRMSRSTLPLPSAFSAS